MLKCLTPQIHTFSKHKCIIISGDTVDKFGVILDGKATILKENSDGDRMIISILNKGDLFGEMLTFSNHKVWPVTVKVHTSCKVLFLTNSDLITRCEILCPWHTSLLQNFIKIISDKALILNK